jgi:4-amino-4-deoxy-L-arabinose transferase-like glycosyltransferase
MLVPAVPSKPSRRVARDAVMTAIVIVVMTAWHVSLLRPDLDWANDDAYQYLSHARNIALHQPYADTGYVFSTEAAEIGPQRYPPALPLLLAPVYLAVGFDSLRPYMAVGLLINAAMLVVLAAWCRNGRPAVASSAIVAILAANPAITAYSGAIIPESLYSLFALLALYHVDRQELHTSTPRSAVLAGLFMGLAVITRTVGIALVLAVLMRTAVRRGREWQRTALTLVIAGAIAALAALLTGGSSTTDYAVGLSNYEWSTPLRNAQLYAGDLAIEFLVPAPGASGAAKLAFLTLAVFAAIGLVRICRERAGPTVWESFVAVYLAIILAWPFYQGTRFLLPILPWAVRAAWIGLTDVTSRPTFRGAGQYVRMCAAALILLMCVPGIAAEFRLRNVPHPDSVSTIEVRELLDFLAGRAGEGARVVVSRPRMIALFTGRAAAGWPRNPDERTLAAHIKQVGATHLVIDRSSPQGAAFETRVLDLPDSTLERRFSNRRFTVFAVRQATSRGGSIQ